MTTFTFTNEFIATKHLDLGIEYFMQNKFREAVFEFDQSLQLWPNDPYAHWNKATALLSLGDYHNGFREYEWGWRLFNWRGFGPVGTADLDSVPIWKGDDLSGKRLLVYHELGFGDAIMAMRYLPELKRRAGHVTLVISSELVRLSEQFEIEVLDKAPAGLNYYDARLPLFSAMMMLGQTVENIPRQPYIAANWKRGAGKLGIAWSGRTQKMFSLDYFLSMLPQHRRFEIFCLQPLGQYDAWFADEDPSKIRPLQARDFTETAEIISTVEHVITIDTAVAHLAGAMGHPSVHLLLPYVMDWRWWHVKVWYPLIKIYRQENRFDWIKPFGDLNKALRYE